MSYEIRGRSYLERAQVQLASGSAAGLFYAAFELRCGVEARMREYLEARQEIVKRTKHGYQIAKLAKGLERAFASGEQIISMSLVCQRRAIRHLLFTPVRASLRKRAQRLGDYLHVMAEYHEPDASYWRELRDYLHETAQELSEATTGVLLGPPLRERGTERVSIVASGGTDGFDPSEVANVGDQRIVGIRYWKTVPRQDALDRLDAHGDFGE